MTSRDSGSAVLCYFRCASFVEFPLKGVDPTRRLFDHDLIFNILRTALMMVVTTNLRLAVLWMIAKIALAIRSTFLAQIARSRARPILKCQIVHVTRDSRASGNMQYLTSRGSTQLGRIEFKTRVQRSGNVTGLTVASELVWMRQSPMPLSLSSLRALATPGSGDCFG